MKRLRILLLTVVLALLPLAQTATVSADPLCGAQLCESTTTDPSDPGFTTDPSDPGFSTDPSDPGLL